MRKIISISGQQGSGKTTIGLALANKIRDELKKSYPIQVTFASTIYEMHDSCLAILKAYGMDRGTQKDGTLLQLLGTEWGRKTLGENVWVDLLKGRIEATRQGLDSDLTPYFIITDCRFENELDAFPEALKVRLQCPREIRRNRCESWRENENHPSEVGLDQYEKDGKFDLYIPTDNQSVEECAESIMIHLRE